MWTRLKHCDVVIDCDENRLMEPPKSFSILKLVAKLSSLCNDCIIGYDS